MQIGVTGKQSFHLFASFITVNIVQSNGGHQCDQSIGKDYINFDYSQVAVVGHLLVHDDRSSWMFTSWTQEQVLLKHST